MFDVTQMPCVYISFLLDIFKTDVDISRTNGPSGSRELQVSLRTEGLGVSIHYLFLFCVALFRTYLHAQIKGFGGNKKPF